MTIVEDLAVIKEEIKAYLEHPYLLKYVPEPRIDEDKMTILYLMFRESGRYQQIKPYIITIMLVQIALDTHDTIHIKSQKNDNQIKKRQLTVLAGDYYSSLYYRILAELPDIKMISLLAHAIQIINEKKMALYLNSKADIAVNIEHLKQIESLLLVHVGQELDFEEWNPIIMDYFLLKRLNKEVQASMNKKADFLSITREDSTLAREIKGIIETKAEKIIQALREVPYLSHYIKEDKNDWPVGF